MRFLFVLILIVAISCNNESLERIAIPRVASMNRMDSSTLAYLDSSYMSAFSLDSLNTVFHSDEEQIRLGECWVAFHKNVAAFLHSRGLHLESNSSCFTTLYCNRDGSVAHFVYAFNSTISSATEAQFTTLIAQYIDKHGLGITAARPFSQCGSVEY